ncbi:hypothetical protein Y032_1027g3426 [Ancylostoma ceylanicum]|uniref:Uncharacterized protein n=1 Tax=Ancylostoma ceylanicum TaxID=53326 RepID=A0A016W6X4_9BILA|nr:hypothetical protein Y032_1027g3426 [Ancylostoma ceylanicum]
MLRNSLVSCRNGQLEHSKKKAFKRSELQTVVDKWRDRGAAFFWRGTGAAENSTAMLQQTTRASTQSPCVSAHKRRAAVPPLVYGRLKFSVIPTAF